jgi:hypothetical protein
MAAMMTGEAIEKMEWNFKAMSLLEFLGKWPGQ